MKDAAIIPTEAILIKAFYVIIGLCIKCQHSQRTLFTHFLLSFLHLFTPHSRIIEDREQTLASIQVIFVRSFYDCVFIYFSILIILCTMFH